MPSPIGDDEPVLESATAALAERRIDRSRPATLAALARLAEVGALKRHPNQKLGDSWEARGLFTLLKSFEEAARPQGD